MLKLMTESDFVGESLTTEELVGEGFANQDTINMDFFVTKTAPRATRKLVTIVGNTVPAVMATGVLRAASGWGGGGHALNAKTREFITNPRALFLDHGQNASHGQKKNKNMCA